YVATLFDTDGAPSGDGWPHEALRTDAARALGLDGSGIRVGVIDSGVDLGNPDLTQANILEGYDYIVKTTQMSDDVSHGTKVAQLLCGDDNGRGVTGIAPACELVPLRCFSNTHSATIAELAQALADAVALYRCDVVNMSWGLANDSETLRRAVHDAHTAGVTLVAAAGNVSSMFTQGKPVYPAAYDEVVSVASIREDLSIAGNSIQNAGVTVCAPGVDIPFVAANGGETRGSGTSFAAPCVSAEMALLRQYANLDGAQCFALLRDRSLDLGSEGRDDAFGYGLPRLDLLLRRTHSSLAGGAFSASVLRQGGAGSFLALAAYDAQGRMAAAQTVHASGGYSSASCALPEGAAQCAAFFLDEAMCPLSEPYRFDLSG
ncbi:MAG: S8 family serine peptidase, partial [Oscillospiraceae bacterium]|nr:S8 family serine peptidase [Oscillospiraceae bacterium]